VQSFVRQSAKLVVGHSSGHRLSNTVFIFGGPVCKLLIIFLRSMKRGAIFFAVWPCKVELRAHHLKFCHTLACIIDLVFLVKRNGGTASFENKLCKLSKPTRS
jgi:hypothetical protein